MATRTWGRDNRRLRPHERLLIACANQRMAEPSRLAMDGVLSDPELDWGALVSRSVVHGVAGALAIHLRRLPTDARIPFQARACLERMLEATRFRNAVMFREA